MVLAHAVVVVVGVGASGCNWVFGLNQTQPWDAGGDAPDAPPAIRDELVWAAVTSDGMNSPTIVYAGIGSEPSRIASPSIQVGPLDASKGPLVDAPYDVATGTFEIPYTLREAPHRIVYKLPDDPMTHEVQWSITGAHLVVPRYMRMDAKAVPPGSGFSITPPGFPNGAPMIFTSGVFNVNDVSTDFTRVGSKVTLDYAGKARPLSLPTGAIESIKGDWVLLTDWASRAGGESSVRFWALAQGIDLNMGEITSPPTEPTLMMGDRVLGSGPPCPGPNCWPTFQTGPAENRMDAALGPLIDPSTHGMGRKLRYGVVPSTAVAPYMRGVAPDYVAKNNVLYFADANDLLSGITVADPSSALGLTRVVTARVSAWRTVMGVKLVSSMQQMEKEPFGLTSVVKWNAPLALEIMLGSTSLSGADDAVIPSTTGQLVLGFTPENNQSNVSADDYEITLYELADSKITPKRIYHVIGPGARLDGNLLEKNHRYVLGITSRYGLPMADAGDYKSVTFPFATSTTMSATFVIQ